MYWWRCSRCWFFLLFVLHVQLSHGKIERWCRCSVLDETCCLDLREAPDGSHANVNYTESCSCLCTNRTHFLSNPFLKRHPYFLAFPNITLNSDVYSLTPGVMMQYDDSPSDYVPYPNLLEAEDNLRLLTKLRGNGNIKHDTWSHLNESDHEDLFGLLLEPKGFEILIALKHAGLIENISDLSMPTNIEHPLSIPYAQLINNTEFIQYYDDIKNNTGTCKELRSYDVGSSAIPGAILGILFVLVVGCFLFCLAFQRGMRKDHTM